MLPCVRLRASVARVYLTARAGLRQGGELPELRVLIEPSCSDAPMGASEGERTGYPGPRPVKRRRTLSRGGTSPSGIASSLKPVEREPTLLLANPV